MSEISRLQEYGGGWDFIYKVGPERDRTIKIHRKSPNLMWDYFPDHKEPGQSPTFGHIKVLELMGEGRIITPKVLDAVLNRAVRYGADLKTKISNWNDYAYVEKKAAESSYIEEVAYLMAETYGSTDPEATRKRLKLMINAFRIEKYPISVN